MDHVNFDLVDMNIFPFDPINFLKVKVMTPKQVPPIAKSTAVLNEEFPFRKIRNERITQELTTCIL